MTCIMEVYTFTLYLNNSHFDKYLINWYWVIPTEDLSYCGV